MSKLKWFSGGTDRSKLAIGYIDSFMIELPNNEKNNILKLELINYKEELIKKESSVPLILSRMQISISNIIIKENISLNKHQSDLLKKLTALSNIRYGY